MPLYELKIKISPQEKKKIIDGLGLELIKEYADSDHYLKTNHSQPKQKIKKIDGRIIHYKISYDKNSGFFVINSNDITDQPRLISDYKTMPSSVSFERTKEVYAWPGRGVRVAFDYIQELKNELFVEVYSEDERKLFAAKRNLVELGYRKFFSKTYDELLEEQKPIYKDPLAWLIIIVVIGIGVFVLWYYSTN